MPGQHSKKASKDRKIEKKLAPELVSEDKSTNGDNESLEDLVKDAEEEELEGLVFGNGAGFMAQLGQQMDVDEDEDSVEEDAGEGSEAEEGEGLEHVDDAAVLH